MNYQPGICNFCDTGCGHFLKTDEGRILGVSPSQNHPVSKGRLCVRGWNIHELLNTNARIKHPLIRKNGKLVKTDYNTAIKYTADNLLNFSAKNPNEIAFLASPRSSNEELFLLMKLARSVYKTNNISLVSGSGHRNSLFVLNEGTGIPGMLGSIEEISETDLLLVIGMDITRMNPVIGSEIHLRAKTGARLLTIDSRRTQIARLSSEYYQVKPGAMKILLAAIAKSAVDSGLYDRDYIQKYTENFDRFLNVIKTLDLKDIQIETGLSLNNIADIANDLYQSKSAMVFYPSGISGYEYDTVSLIYNLFLLFGKIGKPGCGVNPITGICNLQGSYDMGIVNDHLTGFQKLSDESAVAKFNKAWDTELNTWPGMSFNNTLYSDEFKLKALLVVDHDEGIIRKTDKIKTINFKVYIGAYENEFMNYADVVLPIASYAETDGTYTNTERRIQLSMKKTEPISNVYTGWKLYREIARDSGHVWNYSAASDVMNEISSLTPAYSGINYSRLSGSFGIQWPCTDKYPDGTKRIDLENIPDKLKFITVPAVYRAPESSSEFPLLLMIGKSQDYWQRNNIMRNTHIPMREYNATLLLYPEGFIEIHFDDAKNLQIREQNRVKVISPYGSMEAVARISEDIKPGTVYIPYFLHEIPSNFLLEHYDELQSGEDAVIPVRIAKV